MTDLKNINNFMGIEFATYKLKAGVTEEKMLELVKNVEETYLQKEDGFLGHVTLKKEDGTYSDVVFATSKERAKEICDKWIENEVALKFLEIIDDTTVSLNFWQRIK